MWTRNRVLLGSLTACSTLVLSGAVAFAADNWMGTWKLKTAKSTFSPGPAPKSQTITFEPAEGGVKLTTEAVDQDGKATKGGYVAKFDGTDTAFSGNPNADTAAPRRIDANSYSNTWKKAGKVTISIKASVSPDGKTLTAVQTGTDAQGRTVNSTSVFDKQ